MCLEHQNQIATKKLNKIFLRFFIKNMVHVDTGKPEFPEIMGWIKSHVEKLP
jgi:hypothetical protein